MPCERAWISRCVEEHAGNGKVESCQIDTIPPGKGKRCCGRTGERTPLVPLQACAGWAGTVSCHAHPRILLPQNRCLPEPLAAPFSHQPEPRCNTLDFASKVVCQRALLSPVGSVKRFKMQRILRLPLATRAPLDSPFTLSYGRCDFIVVAIRFIPVSSRFAECPCNPKEAVL